MNLLFRAFVKNGIFCQHDVADVMQKVAMVAWKKFSNLDESRFEFWKMDVRDCPL